MTKTRRTDFVKCFSCGVVVSKTDDYCFGCSRYVCTTCVQKYGHFLNGPHGRKPKKSTVTNRDKIVTKRSKTLEK